MAQNAKSYFKWLGSYKGGVCFSRGVFCFGFEVFSLVLFGFFLEGGRCFLFGLVFLDAFLKGK